MLIICTYKCTYLPAYFLAAAVTSMGLDIIVRLPGNCARPRKLKPQIVVFILWF